MWTFAALVAVYVGGIYTTPVWNAAKARVLEQLARYFRS